MTVKLYPYKMASNSAKVLAESLNATRVRENGTYRYRQSHVIINWGNPRTPAWHHPSTRYLNNPAAIQNAACKLRSFTAFQAGQVSIPAFTTDAQVAGQWLSEGQVVVGRSVLNGSGGAGITVYDPASPAPLPLSDRDRLWVKYKKKRHEYRVHVFLGEVLFVQQKRKRAGVERDTTKIRNLANGYVFCRENVTCHDMVKAEAIKAVAALGLDFGAVDVIWNHREQMAYVLEVNTAPGLEGQSIIDYTNAINKATN